MVEKQRFPVHLKRLEETQKQGSISTRDSTAARRTFGGNSIDIESDNTIVNRHMARACISGDRKRLRSVMSPTQIESEQSYRDRRVATNRAVRLPLAFNRLEDVLLRKQADYKHAEPVYKSRDAAIREVNAKFEDAPQQLVADRADAVNQSLRAEVRQLIIQLLTAHSLGQRVLATSRVKLNHTEDIEARLQARQH